MSASVSALRCHFTTIVFSAISVRVYRRVKLRGVAGASGAVGSATDDGEATLLRRCRTNDITDVDGGGVAADSGNIDVVVRWCG